MEKVKVAMVGLGFGAEFIPIYQAHPNAEVVSICRRKRNRIELMWRSVRDRETVDGLRASSCGSRR